jgi:hypothetical protein
VSSVRTVCLPRWVSQLSYMSVEETCDCMRLRGLLSLFPGVLSWGPLQESEPGLLKLSQTLSLTCAVSEFPTRTIDTAGSVSANSKGRIWIGSNPFFIRGTHNTAHPSRTVSPSPATHPSTSTSRLRSVTTKTLLCITV